MSLSKDQNSVIIFDGVCNLCNSSVTFVIKRDKSYKFKFAPLQSETAKNLISKLNLSTDKIDSIILIENHKYYIKSTAAIRICKELGALWSLMYILILVPKPVRDYIYDIVAKKRYKWFGKKEHCMIPTKELESRFLG